MVCEYIQCRWLLRTYVAYVVLMWRTNNTVAGHEREVSCKHAYRRYQQVLYPTYCSVCACLYMWSLHRRFGAAVEWLDQDQLRAKYPWLNADGLSSGVLGTASYLKEEVAFGYL